MVDIPVGKRQRIHPGGAALPFPSITRVNIAGVTGRGVELLGNVAQDIALKQQRANDNAEYEKATIDAQSKVNEKLAELKQNIQDPNQFTQRATEEIKKIITESGAKVGFRNRQRFKAITDRIKLGADKAIIRESFGKTVDLSKATFELVKDSNVEGVLLGTLTEAEAIKSVDAHADDRARNGIFSLQENVDEKKDFRARLAEAKFETDFLVDPVNAIKDLNANVSLSIEAKTNLIDKATRKATHLRAIRKEENKLDREVREKEAFRLARQGKYTEEDLLQDAIDNPDNPMSEDAFRRTLNRIYDVDKAGGVGNPDAFNQMLRNMRLNPKQFILSDIYALADAEDLNNAEIDKLEQEFSSLTTGRSDPSDITTFREYRDMQDSIKKLFAPSQFDAGAAFGIKNLRWDEAYTFAKGKAKTLFGNNRNVDSVMSETKIETFKHMEDYDRLIERFKEQGLLESDPEKTSVLAIEKLIRPALEQAKIAKESLTTITAKPFGQIQKEEELTEEQVAQFEILLDRLDKGEITEKEFEAETDKLQEQEKE